MVNTLKPGAGFNANVADLDPKKVAEAIGYAHKAEEQSTVDFLLHIIPKTFTDAFTGEGSLLQVLLLAVLFGFALLHMGKSGEKIMDLFETLSKAFFGIMSMIMKLAPIGAGAAMAFTIGKFGIESLGPLLKLMGSFYLTCALFVLIVLGTIARLTGFSILRFIRYIRDELLLVLGTSSSESALVPLMRKLERLGCSK
ncbi:cation:dicarboxylase symporter family transporter, partial [Lysobacter sp. 2RAB21]